METDLPGTFHSCYVRAGGEGIHVTQGTPIIMTTRSTRLDSPLNVSVSKSGSGTNPSPWVIAMPLQDAPWPESACASGWHPIDPANQSQC